MDAGLKGMPPLGWGEPGNEAVRSIFVALADRTRYTMPECTAGLAQNLSASLTRPLADKHSYDDIGSWCEFKTDLFPSSISVRAGVSLRQVATSTARGSFAGTSLDLDQHRATKEGEITRVKQKQNAISYPCNGAIQADGQDLRRGQLAEVCML